MCFASETRHPLNMTRNLITLWLLALTANVLIAAEQPKNTFPTVTGRNLHGKDVEFPQALGTNKHNVLIVAFTRKQQPLVDTWLPELTSLCATNKDVHCYELPTIKKMNRLMKWVIYRGMRSGIKEANARSRTVTLHIDKEPFKTQLGIKTEKDIFVFLTDAKGKIRWRSQGTFSTGKFRALKARLIATEEKEE